ncbi:hypothetical protein [Virgibacillus sp. DJP39]|uniref:hypothetical protein n=1 Tax=Virgibacillus sp. DJP39 TaxID=3409790 RepID=UPI003BB71245
METILILSFNFFLASVVDRILAGDVLNFYNIMDDPKFEVMDLFIYMFVYPFFVYLVLYIYSFINHDNIVFFLLLTVMVTMGFEMLSVKLNVFQYKKWNIMYSGIAYTILYSLNVFFLKYVKVVIAKIKFRN